MPYSRLYQLYDASCQRERRIRPDATTTPDETEEQRNKRVLQAAFQQQQNEQQRHKGKATRYVTVSEDADG